MRTAILIKALESGQLPASEFSHRNHVHVAWYYLQRMPLPAAARHFSLVLKAYVRRIGAQDKYHLTLTRAFMHLIGARMRPGEDWQTFARRNPELFGCARSLIAAHYSAEALAQGRTRFIEPDRAPLPAMTARVGAPALLIK
jgi:hypothetical protein